MILLARIDKTYAVTLVLEFLGDGKDFPAIILALVFIGWRPNSRGDGHPNRFNPNRYHGNHGVGRRVDYRDGV